MKNRITKQGFKICSIRDACVIGQVKGMCDRVELPRKRKAQQAA